MSKFDIQDREVIAMCNARRIREQAREQIIEAEYVAIDEAAEARKAALQLIAGVAGRAGIGMVFLGAITRGWTEPAFGLAAAAACFLWAWAFARR